VRRVVVIAVLLASSRARADDVDDLVAKGQELAKQSEWTQAIATFKQADAHRTRTLHACMIALAYTRRELWPQAELYFTRCHARANAADPLPDWAAEAEATLASKIAGANIPVLTISVVPAAATIAVSSFERDESVAPGTIHLAPGHHTLQITAPGYTPATREITMAAGETRTLAVELVRPAPPPPPPPSDPYAPVRWTLFGTGAALVIAGIIVDEVKVQPLRDELAKSQLANTRDHGSFTTWRNATLGLLSGGAVAIAVGAYLAYHHHTSGPTISAQLDHTGGSIVIGWER
jgi:hypothetical protein